MVQINDDYYEDLDIRRMGELLDALARGETPKTGSQIGRKGSQALSGPTSLLDAEVEVAPKKKKTSAKAKSMGRPMQNRLSLARGETGEDAPRKRTKAERCCRTRIASSPISMAGRAGGCGAASRKRGDWDDTKALVAARPREDHRRGQDLRIARPRRCRLSDRPQMVLHAEGVAGRAAELSGHQCR